MKTAVIDPEMPAFLRRFPVNPKKEAAIDAAWKARAVQLREAQASMDIDLEKGNKMVSLVRIWPVGIPRLGDKPRDVKLLALGEKWARFDSGPPNGTSTVPRKMWDDWKKEVLVTNLDTAGGDTAVTAAPATPAARKKKEVAPAPAAPKGRGKKASAAPAPAKGKAAAPKAEGGPSKKDVLWAALQKAGAAGVSYSAACKAVYGEADVPAIGGVLIGCGIRAEEQSLILAKEGKGKDANYVLRKKRKGE